MEESPSRAMVPSPSQPKNRKGPVGAVPKQYLRLADEAVSSVVTAVLDHIGEGSLRIHKSDGLPVRFSDILESLKRQTHNDVSLDLYGSHTERAKLLRTGGLSPERKGTHDVSNKSFDGVRTKIPPRVSSSTAMVRLDDVSQPPSTLGAVLPWVSPKEKFHRPEPGDSPVSSSPWDKQRWRQRQKIADLKAHERQCNRITRLLQIQEKVRERQENEAIRRSFNMFGHEEDPGDIVARLVAEDHVLAQASVHELLEDVRMLQEAQRSKKHMEKLAMETKERRERLRQRKHAMQFQQAQAERDAQERKQRAEMLRLQELQKRRIQSLQASRLRRARALEQSRVQAASGPRKKAAERLKATPRYVLLQRKQAEREKKEEEERNQLLSARKAKLDNSMPHSTDVISHVRTHTSARREKLAELAAKRAEAQESSKSTKAELRVLYRSKQMLRYQHKHNNLLRNQMAEKKAAAAKTRQRMQDYYNNEVKDKIKLHVNPQPGKLKAAHKTTVARKPAERGVNEDGTPVRKPAVPRFKHKSQKKSPSNKKEELSPRTARMLKAKKQANSYIRAAPGHKKTPSSSETTDVPNTARMTSSENKVDSNNSKAPSPKRGSNRRRRTASHGAEESVWPDEVHAMERRIQQQEERVRASREGRRSASSSFSQQRGPQTGLDDPTAVAEAEKLDRMYADVISKKFEILEQEASPSHHRRKRTSIDIGAEDDDDFDLGLDSDGSGHGDPLGLGVDSGTDTRGPEEPLQPPAEVITPHDPYETPTEHPSLSATVESAQQPASQAELGDESKESSASGQESGSTRKGKKKRRKKKRSRKPTTTTTTSAVAPSVPSVEATVNEYEWDFDD